MLLSLPLLALFFFVAFARRSFGFLRNLSIAQRVGHQWRLAAARRRVRSLRARRLYPTPEVFAESIGTDLEAQIRVPNRRILAGLTECARALYEAERFTKDPPAPSHPAELDAAEYRDALLQLSARLSNPDAVTLLHETFRRAFAAFNGFLPPLATRGPDRDRLDRDSDHALSVNLIDVIQDVPGAVEALIEPFCSRSTAASGLFAGLRTQLDMNRHTMSRVSYNVRHFRSPKLVGPKDYDGTPAEVVRGYLRDTPLRSLFEADIPFEIPQAVRFEHQWIVAGSGHGKTQTLQYQIGRDLERVARGEASIVVIDSQGDLIKTIAGLKLFAPGQPLYEKLCLIDPTDIEFPVALNLFDAGLERLDRYSPLDRERLLNGILELYDFVLGSLLSAELTQKQSVIFRYITRLMLHIPGATIHTFRELMEPNGYQKYQQHIAKLEGTARAFFETEFNSKQFEDTKRQVVRRLWGILENRTFERMFSHPKNKLDLFSEMNAGKVILINTAKDLLKQNGTEIFGRFFIALMAQVAQERATLPKDARKSTFCYIDECADYLDHNVSLILEQARKQNLGMVLAHQYIGQLSPKLQESFAANTSIKFAGGVSDKDARALSPMLRCTPEFIFDRPKGHFAAFVRNYMPSAMSLHIPFGYLEGMPQMSTDEHEAVRARMRERYAVRLRETTVPPTEPDRSDDRHVDAAAASEW